MIGPNQRLNAERLGRAKDTVPTRTMLFVVCGGRNQHGGAARIDAPKQRAEILARDLAVQSERFGAAAEPVAGDFSTLAVVVVVRIVLLEVGFGLTDLERLWRKDHHGRLCPLLSFDGATRFACGIRRDFRVACSAFGAPGDCTA